MNEVLRKRPQKSTYKYQQYIVISAEIHTSENQENNQEQTYTSTCKPLTLNSSNKLYIDNDSYNKHRIELEKASKIIVNSGDKRKTKYTQGVYFGGYY